jgi:KaiC/GvpD/RAD55 family RecA-like ATPase
MFTALSAAVFHLDRQGCAIYVTYTCFTLMGLGVKVINITSEEADEKIKAQKSTFDKALKPYIFAAFLIVIIWLLYSIFELHKNI